MSYPVTFSEFEWFSYMLVFRSQSDMQTGLSTVEQSTRVCFGSCI